MRLAALSGLLGVALGAFGAHGLKQVLSDPHLHEIWHTAVFYHLVHAVMLYMIAAGGNCQKCAWNSMALGLLVFSGSLYALVLTGATWLGAITPIGGVLLLVGWGLLIAKPQPSA